MLKYPSTPAGSRLRRDPVRPEADDRTSGERHAVVGERVAQCLEPARRRTRVVVEVREHRRASRRCARVAGTRKAGGLLPDDPEPVAEPSPQRGERLGGLRARGVVDDEHLAAVAESAEVGQCEDAVGSLVRPVARADDDREGRSDCDAGDACVGADDERPELARGRGELDLGVPGDRLGRRDGVVPELAPRGQAVERERLRRLAAAGAERPEAAVARDAIAVDVAAGGRDGRGGERGARQHRFDERCDEAGACPCGRGERDADRAVRGAGAEGERLAAADRPGRAHHEHVAARAGEQVGDTRVRAVVDDDELGPAHRGSRRASRAAPGGRARLRAR